MEKPISVILEESRREIANVINETHLPPVLLLPIIKDIYQELQVVADRQYKEELQQYQDSLKKEDNDKNEPITE